MGPGPSASGAMKRLRQIPVAAIDPRRFASVSTTEQYEELLELIDRGARELRGRVIWNVNSTASGGGVVELVRPLLGYCKRWRRIEQVKRFAILDHDLTQADGELTPTLKVKRAAVYERYAGLLAGLYEQGDQS
jgi:long-subunit acyl-CoA synthetase (AMP-forming)